MPTDVRLPTHELDCADAISGIADELSMRGAFDLLGRSAIGICGSRHVDDAALERATEFGRYAAEHGLGVVSGNAKGIDDRAHAGTLEAGGWTIYVLPQGIASWKPRKTHRQFLTATNHLALSMFDDDASWQSWRAMERNKLIVALSDALVIVGAGLKGGTWNAAGECLKQGKPLLVTCWISTGRGRDGNNALIDKGGIPIRTPGELKAAFDQIKRGKLPQSRTGQQPLL